jgi:hypothetical protein
MSWQQQNRGGGIAQNPPFVIPVQVDRGLEPFIPLFTGYVLDCVQSQANKNQARAMFLELLESDSALLEEIVNELANAVQYFVDSQDLPPNRVEAAIRNTVASIVNAYLAYSAARHPNEFGRVMDAAMTRDVEVYIGEFETMKAEAKHFYRGGNQGDWGRQNQSNQRGWQPPDRSQRGGQGYRTAAEDNWPGNRQSGNNWNRGGNQGGRPSIWDNRAEPRTSNRPSDTSFHAGAGSRPRREFDEPQRAAQTPRQRQVERIDPRQVTVDGHTFFPAFPDKEWPKIINSKRIWDLVLMEDGTQMRPAYLSKWKVSFDPENPVTPWYNPQTHILYHLKLPDGTIVQKPVERQENMNYYDHELDPKLRLTAKEAAEAAGDPVAPAWKLVETLRPNPSSPLATAEPLTDDAVGEKVVEVGLPSDYLITTSLPEGVKRACLRLKVERNDLMKKPFEIYIERAEITTIINPDFDLITELSNADSFEKLHGLLLDNKVVDDELADAIDRRMALAVTQALQQNMGLKGWAISDFRGDFGDLLSALEEDYGKSVVATLRDNQIEIISRFLAFYKPAELDEVRKSLGLEGDTQVLVWRERSSVTRLPVSSTQVNLPSDTGVLLSKDTNPELYQTLESIFERTQDLRFTFHGRYLAFSDGVAYTLVRGYFNEESILVFKANFNL